MRFGTITTTVSVQKSVKALSRSRTVRFDRKWNDARSLMRFYFVDGFFFLIFHFNVQIIILYYVSNINKYGGHHHRKWRRSVAAELNKIIWEGFYKNTKHHFYNLRSKVDDIFYITPILMLIVFFLNILFNLNWSKSYNLKNYILGGAGARLIP